MQQFYCFSTPSFEFSSLKANQIVKSNQHILTVSYTQAEKEPLNHFHITLYNASKAVLAQSDELYAAAGKFEYNAAALEDGTQYYSRAVGATVHGMQVDTGYIPFSVSYVQNDYWAYIDLQNNENDGNIRISCNIKSITGIYSGSGSPIYINDNTAIDLRGKGNKVTFPNEFVIDGDFALKIHGSHFVSGEEIFALEGKTGRIGIKYIEGYFNSYFTKEGAYAFREGLMRFLNNKRPKIMKFDDGRIYMISITDGVKDENDDLADLVHTSFSWVEIGDAESSADLYFNNFIDVNLEA